MKTPMQELIDEMQKSPLMFASALTLIEDTRMLEKEQQVMCEFAIDYTMQAKTAYDFHRAKFNNEL